MRIGQLGAAAGLPARTIRFYEQAGLLAEPPRTTRSRTRLAAYRKRELPIRSDADAAAYQASIPGYVAATVPGDVITFDLHTWHAGTGGGTGWPGHP